MSGNKLTSLSLTRECTLLKKSWSIDFFDYSCFFRFFKSAAQSAHAFHVRTLLQFKRCWHCLLTWILWPSGAVKYFVSSTSDSAFVPDGCEETRLRKQMQQMSTVCARTMATSTHIMTAEASGPTLKCCTGSLPNNAIWVLIRSLGHTRGSLSGRETLTINSLASREKTLRKM